MYKQMLIPLDGSKLAEVVFSYAKELAGRLGVNLVFLNVCSPEESELLPMRRAYVERMAEIIRNQSIEIQKGIGVAVNSKPVEAKADVVTGYPAEEILRYADENKIDLILIATHGRSGIRRWAMGSVAEKVLRMSNVPTWLVRANVPAEIIHDQLPVRSIIVPLDGSKLSESVLPHAETIAKQRGAELIDVVLLRVCEPPVIPADYPPTMPLTWEEHVKQELAKSKKVGEEYLAGIEKRLKNDGIKVRSEVLTGTAAYEILNYINKNPANLIVMATQGRTGLSRWTYGSVAEKVLYGGNTPVLLVKPG